MTFRVVQQAETQAVRSLQRRLGLDELTRESFARALGKTLSSKGEEGETARTWIVQQNWRTWSHHTKQSLRKNLRIPDDTGCMRAPADLFDPRERAILELFGGHMHVPSEQYRSDDWLYFLGHLGMRHRLEAGDLLRLVDAWAAEGAGADSYDSLLAWLSAAFERADGDRKELTYLEE